MYARIWNNDEPVKAVTGVELTPLGCMDTVLTSPSWSGPGRGCMQQWCVVMGRGDTPMVVCKDANHAFT